MRKKRFLAIAAAIAISISFVTPVTAFATETEDAVDDEQEEGEQSTIMVPDADTDADTSSDSSASAGTNNTSTGVKSSDSSLAHMSISPGSLSPAFSSGTHEYTATVDAGVTAISVAARPNSSNAVIASVSGAKSLKPGTNTVKVVVEAQNGATTTYTITVNCGAAGSTSQPTAQETSDTTDEGLTLEGEISTIDDSEAAGEEKSEVTFDDNGYLIYEGNAYVPTSMMPEGEYVSLDKYNTLYEQAQAQKTNDMRLLIILIVVLVLFAIVILNLGLKLRDLRQDMALGLTDLDDEEEPAKKQTDTSMIPDVRIPDIKAEQAPRTAKVDKAPKPENASKVEKAPKAEKAPGEVKAPGGERTPRVEKAPRAEKPQKPQKTRSAKKEEDLEILDLNDL